MPHQPSAPVIPSPSLFAKYAKRMGHPAYSQILTLRPDLENIGDDEVIGDASLERLRRLRSRLIQFVHRLQSTQDIHVIDALPFGVFARLYVSPGKNCGDLISFILILIRRIGRAPK